MSDLVKIFENEQFGKIRMVVIDGKPYAVGVDVAKALEYARPADAITAHCDGSVKYRVTDSLGREQDTKVIPQGDIVRLIVGASKQSKNETIKEKAKKFETWIFDEVIPTVLETGSYNANAFLEQIPKTYGEALRAYADAWEQKQLAEKENMALTIQIENMKPKIDYTDKILQSSKTVPITLIAKDYGMSAQAMNKILHDAHIIWKCDKQWVLYADYQGNGYAHSRTEPNINKYGETCGFHTQLEWTQKGRLFLYNFLKEKRHLLPMIERNEDNNHAETD